MRWLKRKKQFSVQLTRSLSLECVPLKGTGSLSRQAPCKKKKKNGGRVYQSKFLAMATSEPNPSHCSSSSPVSF